LRTTRGWLSRCFNIKKAAGISQFRAGLAGAALPGIFRLGLIIPAAPQRFLCGCDPGGAGTSTNMNANEVIATGVGTAGYEKAATIPAPAPHVNMSQSTNDVYHCTAPDLEQNGWPAA